MIKAIKKAVKWYFNTTANSIYLTPTGMIPMNFYLIKDNNN